jgi:GntR family transcriptional regulator
MEQLSFEKGSLPLYIQLRNLIGERIEQNVYKPGDLIPGENELQVQFGVSRITARQALALLEREGLVKRQRGIGTTVLRKQILHEESRGIKSFTKEMEERGIAAGTKSVRLSKVKADSRLMSIFSCSRNASFTCIDRVRTGDGVPIVNFVTWYPAALILPEDPRRYTGSIYDLLQECGIPLPASVRETFRAVTADRRLARKLDLRPGDPVLLRERIAYDGTNKVMGYTDAYYAGTRYSYSTQMDRWSTL